MPTYQVAIVKRPKGWEPECLDDTPLELEGPLEIRSENDDLFATVREAIAFNQQPESEAAQRWAVVVEPGCLGRIWPAARVCTPINYKVTAIWWPEGWEPNSPLDVPNCIWHTQGRVGNEWMTYDQAEKTIAALNRQCIDSPGTTWHVIVGVENESVSKTVSYDPTGTETTVEVRRIHVIRPEKGGTGDCSHCPAHDFSCAKAEWSSRMETLASRHSRLYHTEAEAHDVEP